MRKYIVRDAYEWPYNLIAAILNNEGQLPGDLPYDIEPSLYFVLLDLTERENKVIAMYYRDGKTMMTIGKEFCVTVERVRQIIDKSLRKLRCPYRIAYIKHGIKNIMKYKSEEEHKAGYALGYKQAQKDMRDNSPDHAIRRNVGLEEMDLSVRAFNCLCRANLRTSDDIARCGYFDLIKIRNLGRHTLNEIIQVMDSLGYETGHMREPGSEEDASAPPGGDRT